MVFKNSRIFFFPEQINLGQQIMSQSSKISHYFVNLNHLLVLNKATVDSVDSILCFQNSSKKSVMFLAYL